MTRRRLRNHLLALGGALVVLGLLGMHLGINNDWWYLAIGVAVVLHLGVFGALIAWIARRVRGHAAEARESGAARDGVGVAHADGDVGARADGSPSGGTESATRGR